MKYVAIATHPPNACPSSNAAVREAAKKAVGNMESLSKTLNVKLEGAYILSPSHKAVYVVEAPSIESVRQLLSDLGLAQWNDIELYPSWSLQEAMKDTEAREPIKW